MPLTSMDSVGPSFLPTPELDGFGAAVDRGRVFEALFQVPAQPQRLGRYVVLGTLGMGGMGTVLEAFDRTLDRRVAVKILHKEIGERYRTRLIREAQAMAKLSHPNVVQVYEVGQADGKTFVAMELVEGKTLGDWMRHEPRPSWHKCVEVFHQTGRGLAAAHAQGLVHRDFKPANTIIDNQERPRILDFGLARRTNTEADDIEPSTPFSTGTRAEDSALDAPLTQTGAVLGTPAYMPPEQMAGGEADARSDQFSFCVSLYEAVYGKRPYEGSSLMAMMVSMTSNEIRPAPKGTKVPPLLHTVLQRGLAYDPDQRWSSMDELLSMLDVVLSTHDPDLDDPSKRQTQRHFTRAISLLILTLLSLSIGLANLGIDVFSPVGSFISHVAINTTALVLLWSIRAKWGSSPYLSRIVAVFAIMFLIGIACHGTGMVRGSALEDTLAFELLMMAALTTLGAILISRWQWLVAALCSLGWLASLLVAEHTTVFFMTAIMLSLVVTSLTIVMKPYWNMPLMR